VPEDARSEQVQTALIASAGQFATSAVDAYLDERFDAFLMHAATTSEHLLKASLCAQRGADR
jgi:hypothetical protein